MSNDERFPTPPNEASNVPNTNSSQDADLFEVVEDAQNGSKLQADAQYGLRFVPETAPGDVYGLGADPSQTSPSPQTSQTTQASPISIASESSEPDVYGLAEPLPTPSSQHAAAPNSKISDAKRDDKPSKLLPKNDKTNKKNDKKRDQFDEFDDAACSLDEIYERKRRERLERGDELYRREERPDLPDRPFWDRIFKPFASIGFLFRIGLTSAAAFVPLFLATLFFARALAGNVEEMMKNNQEMGALVAFFSCLWKDQIIFLLFCFFWGVFSIPHSFHIFLETANGADEIDEWPEYNFIGGLGQFLWLSLLITIAGTPGAALFSTFGLNSLIGFVFSATLLTPIFFLSCMQTDALFTLLTKEVFFSLKRLYRSWLNFYFIAFAFLFGTVGLALVAIGFATRVKGSWGKAALTAALVSTVFSFIPALYLRFLGRLAWIVEDEARNRDEENEDEEENENKENTND